MKGVHILKYSANKDSQLLVMSTWGGGCVLFCSHGKTLTRKQYHLEFIYFIFVWKSMTQMQLKTERNIISLAS